MLEKDSKAGSQEKQTLVEDLEEIDLDVNDDQEDFEASMKAMEDGEKKTTDRNSFTDKTEVEEGAAEKATAAADKDDEDDEVNVDEDEDQGGHSSPMPR